MQKNSMGKKPVFLFLLAFVSFITSGAEDPKSILEKCFVKCLDLQSGSYEIAISKKGFNGSAGRVTMAFTASPLAK